MLRPSECSILASIKTLSDRHLSDAWALARSASWAPWRIETEISVFYVPIAAAGDRLERVYSAAADLPSAIARRDLMGGKYLEETMEPTSSEATPSAFFRRNAFLNYNLVTKRYEYASLD